MSELVKVESLSENATCDVRKPSIYIPDTIQHINAEGEIIERSGWFEHAKMICTESIILLDFACLMHNIKPVYSCEIKDLSLEEVIAEIGCSEKETTKIKKTYQSLYDYYVNFQTVTPLKQTSIYSKFWNNHPAWIYNYDLKHWVSDTENKIPEKLEHALIDYNQHHESMRDDCLYRINNFIAYEATSIPNRHLKDIKWGLAQACCFVMGRPSAFGTDIMMDEMRWRSFEQEIANHFNNPNLPDHGDNYFVWHEWANEWSGLKDIYDLVYYTIMGDSMKKQSVLFDPNEQDIAKWKVKPSVFVALCHELGIRIRPQLKEMLPLKTRADEEPQPQKQIGRPSKIATVMEEYHRRVEAKELIGVFYQELQSLVQWAQENNAFNFQEKTLRDKIGMKKYDDAYIKQQETIK
ncbi:MAG: hypothetical protein EAZ52_05330 [Alphaproteobacteria bacterium]|nr:MAG: hypothetical protein EAZ52_05330 [Alphaproteobacteria bacterium]